MSTYSYDMAGQLTDITHKNGGTVLARSAYTLDVLGRRTAQTREDGITETYGYDTTSQLTSADYGTSSPLAKAAAPVTRETFAYDALGNRTQVGRVVPNAPSTTTAYTANALNQYTQVAGVAFAYDANGNLTNDGKQTYRYDAQNRLLAVEPVAPATGAVRAEFAYDARNRAVARTYWTLGKAGAWVLNPDDSRALTYDVAWTLLAERTRNCMQVGEYIHGQQTDEVLRAELKPYNLPFVASYPLPNGLGSIVALANDGGKLTERFRYVAYGQPASLSAAYQPITASPSGYRLLFTGREWLNAIELNEHRNRYYSASLGRWLSTDPIGFRGGENVFAYVANSPLNATDIMGLDNDCDPRLTPCIVGDVWRPDLGEYGPPLPTRPEKRNCVLEAAACGTRGVLICSAFDRRFLPFCPSPLKYRLCMAAYATACAIDKESCDRENQNNGY